mmetsp:Transcript_53745/g.112183  ORF Transcript_53745/g.112183 Transcript_53745/m.112183 type:complete len:154 (-) Transcript_53745:67-528(-)
MNIFLLASLGLATLGRLTRSAKLDALGALGGLADCVGRVGAGVMAGVGGGGGARTAWLARRSWLLLRGQGWVNGCGGGCGAAAAALHEKRFAGAATLGRLIPVGRARLSAAPVLQRHCDGEGRLRRRWRGVYWLLLRSLDGGFWAPAEAGAWG